MMDTRWDRESAGLRALIRDLSGQQPTQIAEECRQVQSNLDLYVSDELDSVDVRLRHPHMWEHLQVCADCRDAHDSLLDMLSAEIDGRLAALPPRPPEMNDLHARSWQLRTVSTSDGALPAMLFLFAPSYLRQSLKPVAGVSRSAGGVVDRLLLSYMGDEPDREVVVQLYVRPDPVNPNSLHLTLAAVGEPMPTAAELTWGGQIWPIDLGPDGDALVGPVPASVLTGETSPTETFSLRLLF